MTDTIYLLFIPLLFGWVIQFTAWCREVSTRKHIERQLDATQRELVKYTNRDVQNHD